MVDRNRPFESPESDDLGFEQDLRHALRPRSASPDFTARLMQQIPPDAQPEATSTPRRVRILPWLPAALPASFRLTAVASLLIVVLAGSFAWRQYQRHVEGERARQKVFIALQITHATLQQVAENISSIQNRKDLHP